MVLHVCARKRMCVHIHTSSKCVCACGCVCVLFLKTSAYSLVLLHMLVHLACYVVLVFGLCDGHIQRVFV